MRRWKVVLAALLLVVVFLAGRGCGRRGAGRDGEAPAVASAGQAADWTCSMHPQIRQPKPGACPLCGMDLIPAVAPDETGSDAPREAVLSEAAARLAEVAVAPVERRAIDVQVPLVGKIELDQTRVAYVSARVAGRIDRLYADYEGMPVKPGDHLADMYSPELVSAQQELLQAVQLPSGGAKAPALLDAARERLRLWGLTAEQIREIESSGKVRDHLTFFAPIGGIVVEKEAREGLYVDTGMRLFTVADLGAVWVLLDAYESDLNWLRYGQKVEFHVEAYPGERFEGTISFISPLLDPGTRTVKVRVNAPNPDQRLKPGMFVRSRVAARVGADGAALATDLHGKWICPMHPEVVKDSSGACDVCGMPLVAAESIGHAKPTAAAAAPLIIPSSAVLLTGPRALVYVAVKDRAGTYEGREVVLGPRAGDFYVVASGLAEGEQVVVNGTFKIDSSLQIQGKPSMMAPQAGAEAERTASVERPAAVSEAARQQLDALLGHVLEIGKALAADDGDAARGHAGRAATALAAIDMAAMQGSAHDRWMQAHQPIRQALDNMQAASDIGGLRTAFEPLSLAMTGVVRDLGPLRGTPIRLIHCPMAFDNRGASWLQATEEIRNPYFGKEMLECGEVRGEVGSGR